MREYIQVVENQPEEMQQEEMQQEEIQQEEIEEEEIVLKNFLNNYGWDNDDKILNEEDEDEQVFQQYFQEEDEFLNLVQVGGSLDEPVIEKDLKNCHQIVKLDVSKHNIREIILPDVLIEKLNKIIKELRDVKIQFGINIEFIKDEEIKTYRISNSAVPLTDTFIDDGIKQLNEKIAIRNELGSSWILNRILEINFKVIKISNISRLSGSGYIPTPIKLKNKAAIVNVKNNDDLCFIYSILVIIKQNVIGNKNKNRVSKYTQFVKELKFNELDMPMKLINIPMFESKNPGLAINVFSWNSETVDDNENDLVMKHPNLDIIHRSKVKDGRKINLLLLEKGDKFHYTAIMNLNRLLNRDIKGNGVQICSNWCENCLNGFRLEKAFITHKEDCEKLQTGTTLFKMPINKYLSFKDFSKTVTPPFVIYADFESVLQEDERYHKKHVPISAGLLLVNNFTNEFKYQQFIGLECVYDFLLAIEKISKKIVFPYYEENSHKPLEITAEEELQFVESRICYLCRKELVVPVRDHDHYTGKYLGAACNECNLSRKIRYDLHVVFHNLRGYDLHHILTYGLSKFPQWNISCIPTTTEKFLSLTAHCSKISIKFIDSYQFINSSLDAAVKSISTTPLTTKEFNDARIIKSKGIFPYEFAKSLEILETTTSMPAIWDNVSEEDYQKALEMWQVTRCKNLLDYMMVYLKLDVFLLADFFQQFRAKSIANNKLEPLNFYGIPGMSWASALMTLDSPIELLTDNDMYNFFEYGIRGGLTFINKHHVVSDENTELLYIDINNLYGWALSQKLPFKDFVWVHDGLEDILTECRTKDLETLSYGYTMEVDLEIPNELHDYLSDLPVAAEHQCPPGSKVKKLLLTHYPKKNYVVHWRLLQIYLNLGVKVTRINRAVKFTQDCIFKKYIDMNTELRSKSTTELEKNYFKLLNNSLYGKSVENLKKRINLRLCNTAKKLLTYVSKPGFRKSFKIDNDLIAVQLNKEIIWLDRPSYIGQTVLDLSKLRMYQLQYLELEKYRKHEKCEINIVAGDTDSFFLELKNIKIERLLSLMVKDKLLDTSNYNPSHPLYSMELNSVVGKFKDESKGGKYKEWVFLRPKCYSLLKDEASMKAKGITLKNTNISHQSYLNCYNNNNKVLVTQYRIGTKNHQLYSFMGPKVALTNNDDKRYWTDKNKSLPYGHFKIQNM